jgi:diguanylate cyclase (GGDEF)-like protein
MLAADVRFDDPTGRTDPDREPWLPAASPWGEYRNLSAESWTVRLSKLRLLSILLFGFLLGVLAPISSAIAQAGATNHDGLSLFSSVGSVGAHPAHRTAALSHPRALIDQVRFNQIVLPFEQGVTVGPLPGDLEIQFAAPASAASDHLRYRLVGFDSDWTEAGKEREAIYSKLPPGNYQLDFEEADSASLGGSVMASLPIVVVPPYWQTGRFRAMCGILLLVVIFLIYKLRVHYLLRKAKGLEEEVNQTKAELHLAVKIAGDAQRTLKEQALKDSLTGLWNRRAIFAMLEKEVCRAERDHLPITLVMIDLDHFKTINDNYGHLTGDAVLREAANRIFELMRPYDFVGRYGGEEFLIVLPGCSPGNGIQRAEDFRRIIADRPVPTSFGPLPVTCSLGVAAYDRAMPPEHLIHQADEALYRAKRLGRNCVCVGSPAPPEKAGPKPAVLAKASSQRITSRLS